MYDIGRSLSLSTPSQDGTGATGLRGGGRGRGKTETETKEGPVGESQHDPPEADRREEGSTFAVSGKLTCVRFPVWCTPELQYWESRQWVSRRESSDPPPEMSERYTEKKVLGIWY